MSGDSGDAPAVSGSTYDVGLVLVEDFDHSLPITSELPVLPVEADFTAIEQTRQCRHGLCELRESGPCELTEESMFVAAGYILSPGSSLACSLLAPRPIRRS